MTVPARARPRLATPTTMRWRSRTPHASSGASAESKRGRTRQSSSSTRRGCSSSARAASPSSCSRTCR
eukprot:8964300-Alexandrium_andersonii.AAC.1